MREPNESEVFEALNFIKKATYERGQSDERAAIVAWLRKGWSMVPCGIDDDIEAGEHRK